jgi:acyl carrier protein
MKPSDLSHDHVSKTVLSMVATLVGRKVEEIPLDESLTDLGFESLDAFNVLYAIEEEFGIEIPDEKARSLGTVRDFIDCVTQVIEH